MYWNKPIIPPSRDRYLQRCVVLRNDLQSLHEVPPVIIVGRCWDVIREAFGGSYRAYKWILVSVVSDVWEDLRRVAQFNWHMYVRLRTREETVERMYPVDVDTIAGFQTEAEVQEWVEKEISEQGDQSNGS